MTTAPLRRFVTCSDGGRVPLNSEERAAIPGAIPYWGANGVVDYVGEALFEQELVLLGEDGAPFDDPTRDVAFLVNEAVWVNNHIHVLVPHADVDSRFLTYALNAIDWMVHVSGSTRLKLTQDDMMSARIPVAPLAEQRAIADYLDAETARIDALIAKKQQLIRLLEERHAEANEAALTGVTGAERRTSSSGFFAEIAATWGETTLRHLGCEVQTGPFGSQLHAEEYVEDGWPVVNPANIRHGEIRSISTMTVSDTKREELQRHVLRPGDIVFGRRGEMGRAALIQDRQAGWLCGTGSLRLRITGDLLTAEYLAELLRTKALRRYFELTSVGSTMDNLNSEILLSMPCLVPSRAQQETVVGQVRLWAKQSEAARTNLARQIALLTERRQALITAAVTGEFAVPGAP